MRYLTSQEKLFVQNYINTRDMTNSAIKAGIDKKVALRVAKAWLRDDDILKSINEEIDKTAEKVKLTREWVLKETHKVYTKCTGEKFNAKSSIDALKLIDQLLTKEEGMEDLSKPAAQINITTNKDSLDFKIM